MNSTGPRAILTLAMVCLCAGAMSAGAESEDLVEGLVASYRDDERTVLQVVMLPELGLAADESPHPAIKPSFTAVFEGVLWVALPGRYRFESEGVLWLDGERVRGEVGLDAGRHGLRLIYERSAGPVRAGLSWQSEHFIREPVPPGALWHEKTATPPKSARDVAGRHPSPPHRIAQAMSRMKCASCHEAGFLATMHHKFAPDALLPLMRHAGPMKWYGSLTGPLLEEGGTMTRLASDLDQLPRPARRRGEPARDPGEGMKMIGAQGGYACIACHDIKHHRSAAETKGPNLSLVTQRVSYDWFVRWMKNPQRLKPGVPMPAFFAAQEPEEQQRSIDALWDYLLQGEEMRLPGELRVDPQQFVLTPMTKPLVNRSYLRLPDGRELLRAICVGLPNGVSYCFDAQTCQLAHVWTGGFLDMAPHWKNQSGHPTPAVGETFHLPSAAEGLRIGDEVPVFRGYELVGGIPRFEWTLGDTEVRLLMDAPSPGEVRLAYSIATRAGPVEFVGPPADAPVTMTASVGKWTGNRLTITEPGAVTLTMEQRK